MEISYFKKLQENLEVYNLSIEKFMVIKEFIKSMGIPINLMGHKYIVNCLVIMLSSKEVVFLNELYQEISEIYNISKQSVEISIRNAIKKALNSDEQKVRNILGIGKSIKLSNSVFLNAAKYILIERFLKIC